MKVAAGKMCVGWVCLNNFRIEDESANSTGTRGAHGGVISVDFYLNHLVLRRDL